jgi:hypothetical protein
MEEVNIYHSPNWLSQREVPLSVFRRSGSVVKTAGEAGAPEW